MASFPTTDPICKEIAEALGFKRARKVVLTLEAGDAAIVEVEYFAEKDGVAQLPVIIKRCKLVPLTDEEDVTAIGDEHRAFAKTEES